MNDLFNPIRVAPTGQNPNYHYVFYKRVVPKAQNRIQCVTGGAAFIKNLYVKK